MRRTTSAAAFAADPIDAYWAGPTQMVWCRDPSTCGSMGWGEPTEADVVELLVALELVDSPAIAPQFDVFMDHRAIVAVPWNALARLVDAVKVRMPVWGSRIRRQAVVHAQNATGAALAGVGPMLGVPYPLHFDVDVDAALAWLGWAEGSPGATAVAEVAAHAAAAQSVPSVVRRMRDWLETALAGGPTIDAAAAALATAPRSLQRELAEAGTSFSDELLAARVRVAAELLIATDDKVEAIARAVGYATASRLAEAFRRVHGETPAEYRARRR